MVSRLKMKIQTLSPDAFVRTSSGAHITPGTSLIWLKPAVSLEIKGDETTVGLRVGVLIYGQDYGMETGPTRCTGVVAVCRSRWVFRT